MRPHIEQSNALAPLPPFRSWLGYITNTSGYDFRKGQASFVHRLHDNPYDRGKNRTTASAAKCSAEKATQRPARSRIGTGSTSK